MTPHDTFVVFELADSAYAVRSSHVQHVEMLEHITPVPQAAAAVDGVVFSRGQVIPAINLRARFGLPRREPTLQSRLIFLRVQDRVVALIVDAAREFQRLAPDAIRPIQETLVGVEGNYVEGVTTVKDRQILILDVGRVLSVEETTPPTLAAPAS